MSKINCTVESRTHKLHKIDQLLSRSRRRRAKATLASKSKCSSMLAEGSMSLEVSTTKDKQPGPQHCSEETPTQFDSRSSCAIEALQLAAVREILAETKRAAVRAELIGSQGWKKPTSLSVNKRFLKRTLEASLPRQRRSAR